jgi:plasmid replication initiation protein
MGDFSEAARRARGGVAANDARAVVHALEPHRASLQTGRHLGAALDFAWALGALGRCDEAEALLLGIHRSDASARLAVTLARAGWF